MTRILELMHFVSSVSEAISDMESDETVERLTCLLTAERTVTSVVLLTAWVT